MLYYFYTLTEGLNLNSCYYETLEKNFNEAVKISTGDYIFPLAQDDEFYDEKVIENIVENFKGNICTTFRECISKEKRIIGVFPEKKRIKNQKGMLLYHLCSA